MELAARSILGNATTLIVGSANQRRSPTPFAKLPRATLPNQPRYEP